VPWIRQTEPVGRRLNTGSIETIGASGSVKLWIMTNWYRSSSRGCSRCSVAKAPTTG
jgi:hypothetical protein